MISVEFCTVLYSTVRRYCTVPCNCVVIQCWMSSVVVRLFTTIVLVFVYQCNVTQLYCVALHWYNVLATAWYYCSPYCMLHSNFDMIHSLYYGSMCLLYISIFLKKFLYSHTFVTLSEFESSTATSLPF